MGPEIERSIDCSSRSALEKSLTLRTITGTGVWTPSRVVVDLAVGCLEVPLIVKALSWPDKRDLREKEGSITCQRVREMTNTSAAAAPSGSHLGR